MEFRMKKKLMNKRYVKACAYLQSVLYGKAIALIANILATSNRVATTKASAPVVATRSHLALKHLAIIAVIAITGFTIACPSGSKSSAQAYTCPNGDPKIGTTTNESTVNCIACDTGFSLESNTCMAMDKMDSSPWTLRDSGTTEILRAVTYGGPSGRELFVAVGDCPFVSGRCTSNGVIITSPDGITWTDRDSGIRGRLFSQLFGVTYGGASGSELFVAVGLSGIITSPDGITWTVRDTTDILDQLFDVTYGGASGIELFVAVGGRFGGGAIFTSPDGITWTARTSGTMNGLRSVTYGNGVFIAAGSCPKNSNNDCSADGVILTSPDGITWTAQTSALQSNFYGIANRTVGSNTFFVAVGGCPEVLNSNCSHSNPIVTSSNGISWATKENPSGELLFGVTATADGFLAVGLCPLDSKNERCIGNATIVTSSDGVAWTAEDSGVQTVLSGAAYGNGTSVIVGNRNNCSNLNTNSDCTGNSVILTK